MNQVQESEYNFYALFPTIQYLKAREQKAQYPKGYLIDNDLSSKDRNGKLDYHHLVVYNDIKKEVIYSIKGTYWGDFGDLFNDILIMASVRVLELFNELSPILRNNIYQIAENIIKKYKLNKAKNYKIIFSSHSLGATLQQILIMRNVEQANNNKFMRFRMSEYEKGFNKPMLDEKEQEDKGINIYEYVDKVYSFEPGVGVFDSIVSVFDKLLLSSKHTEKLRLINNIFYVPFTGTNPTALITDRFRLEKIFIGNIQQVQPTFENSGHAIYNYIDQSLITLDKERQYILGKKLESKLKEKQEKEPSIYNLTMQYFEIGKYIYKRISEEILGKKKKLDYNDIHKLEMGLKDVSQQISNNIMNNEKEFEQKHDIKQVERDLDIKLEIKRIVLGYYNLNSPDYHNDKIVLSDVDLKDFKFKDELKAKIDTSSDTAVKPTDISNEEWEDIKKYLLEFKGSNKPYSKEDIDYLIKNSNHNIKVYSVHNIIYDNMPPIKKVRGISQPAIEEIQEQARADAKAGRPPKTQAEVEAIARGIKSRTTFFDVSPSGPFTINNFASSASKNPQVGSAPSVHSLRGSDDSSSIGGDIASIKNILNRPSMKSKAKGGYAEAIRETKLKEELKTKARSHGKPLSKKEIDKEVKEIEEMRVNLIDPYSKGFKFGERARFPEVSTEKTIVEETLDKEGKPIKTTKKVKEVQTGRTRSKIPVVKEAKAPAPPKIIKPKPKAVKEVKPVTKPESLTKPKKAVPTVPKPKKIVSAKVSVKKLGPKPDTLHKL